MNRVGLTGLCKIELPADTITLSDGGFTDYAGDTYYSKHATFGTIGGMKELTEGIGDEVPALELTLLIPEGVAPGDVTQPGFQRSRVRFWIAEFDVDDGTIVGTPDTLFDGQIDQTTWSTTRELSMSIVSTAERLFERNIGNSLSDSWHQSVWSGEKGHANATGLAVPVAWGAEKPPRTGPASYVRGVPRRYAGSLG
jgi:hypothetical protein